MSREAVATKETMLCLMCGNPASYYLYGNNKRRWPEQTNVRVAYCPHCSKQPGLSGKMRVVDHHGVLILRSVQRRAQALRCRTCGDNINWQRKQLGLCRYCAGDDAVGIDIRRCEFADCPYGADGGRAWMVCGHGMSGARYRKGQKFCSKDCAIQHNKRLYRYQREARLRDPNARRHTAKRKRRLRVAYLHGYRCQECRRLIDVSRPPGDPEALEIDHIVPVSDGGRDNIGNLRPLHRRCHQRRQADAQLGLDLA